MYRLGMLTTLQGTPRAAKRNGVGVGVNLCWPMAASTWNGMPSAAGGFDGELGECRVDARPAVDDGAAGLKRTSPTSVFLTPE